MHENIAYPERKQKQNDKDRQHIYYTACRPHPENDHHHTHQVSNAYLDWLWWLIEPVCMMLIYAVMFGVVFHASERYFPVFIFIGLTMHIVKNPRQIHQHRQNDSHNVRQIIYIYLLQCGEAHSGTLR